MTDIDYDLEEILTAMRAIREMLEEEMHIPESMTKGGHGWALTVAHYELLDCAVRLKIAETGETSGQIRL